MNNVTKALWQCVQAVALFLLVSIAWWLLQAWSHGKSRRAALIEEAKVLASEQEKFKLVASQQDYRTMSARVLGMSFEELLSPLVGKLSQNPEAWERALEIVRRGLAKEALEKLLSADYDTMGDLEGLIAEAWGQVDVDSACRWLLTQRMDKRIVEQNIGRGIIEGKMGNYRAAIPSLEFLKSLSAEERKTIHPVVAAALHHRFQDGEALDILQQLGATPRTEDLDARRDMLYQYISLIEQSAYFEHRVARTLGTIADHPIASSQVFDWFTSVWAQRDPQAALAWTLGLPANPLFRNDPLGLPRAMKEWDKKNRQALADYVETIPTDHAYRELIAEVMVELNAESNPAAAIMWYQRLHTPSRRQSVAKLLGL